MTKISAKAAYSILIIIFISILSCIIFNISLAYGFLASIIICSFYSLQNGFKMVDLINMIKKQISECRSLFMLIALIGATISIWMSSGIIPTMIYYGFEYMTEMNFLFATFVITSITSLFLGTAVGTISTVGIVFLGLGKAFGIPDNIVLGAIVSGAFIADKISPISGIFNLTLVTVKTSYQATLKVMFTTLLPTYLLVGILYFYIGTKYSVMADLANFEYLKLAIKESFFVSPMLLLLPLLIVVMSLLGIKIIQSTAIGLLGGIIVSFLLQKMDFVSIISAIFTGYQATTSSAELNNILVSGGITSMLEVLLIIFAAIALSSILEGTGIIRPIINTLTAKIKSKGDLIFKTGFISSMLTIITCEQSVGIILPGRLLKNKCHELELSNAILARTISDTGTIIAPLIPWNVNALFILIITGVSAIEYAPYAMLCYIFPVITYLVACGYKMKYNKVNI